MANTITLKTDPHPSGGPMSRFFPSLFFTAIGILWAHITCAKAEEPPTLLVRGRVVEPLPLALGLFSHHLPYSSQEASLLLNRLSQDLAYHGALTTFTADLPSSASFYTPDYRFFRALGAEFALLLHLSSQGSTFKAAFRLGETGVNREILARELVYPSPPDPASLADRIATRVIEELLKITPPFTKRIMFQYREPEKRWRGLGITDFLGGETRTYFRGERLVLSPAFVGKEEGVIIGNSGNLPTILLFPFSTFVPRVIHRSSGNLFQVVYRPRSSPVELVFSEEQKGNVDLYLWRSGKGIERLTSHPQADYSPTFSPDGSRLAFISERSGTPQIWMKDLETGEEKPLFMSDGILSAPDWSPDGKWLACINAQGNRFFLLVVDLETRTSSSLLEDTAPIEHPSFAIDNRTLVFSRLEGSHYTLYRVDRLIPLPHRLTHLAGDARMPVWERE